jgi:hypothetical protein
MGSKIQVYPQQSQNGNCQNHGYNELNSILADGIDRCQDCSGKKNFYQKSQSDKVFNKGYHGKIKQKGDEEI